MALYRPPDLDWAAPIVDPLSGRVTPYFQRFWQEMSFTAADGGSAAPAIAALQASISSINGQITVINASLAGKVSKSTFTAWGTPTGTLTRTTFDTATVTLPQLAQRVAALIQDLK